MSVANTTEPPVSVLDQILLDLQERGRCTYRDDISVCEHALQCATFASEADEPAPLVAACLLHDYGLLLPAPLDPPPSSPLLHDGHIRGAEWLTPVFVEDVVEPIRLQTTAKRYLAARSRDYIARLTPSSLRRLLDLGGPMSPYEAAEFEDQPGFTMAVRLRRYHDMGKLPGLPTRDLSGFRPLLESLLLH